MPIARRLPNTVRDKELVFVRNASKLPQIMRSGKYASAADKNGAIGAWIDDSGAYCCHAMRHLHTIDSQTFPTFKAVKEWYSTWIKKIA